MTDPFANRHPVEERDGRLFFRGADLGPTNRSSGWYWDYPHAGAVRDLRCLGFSPHMQLRHCEGCRAWFIGHRSASRCADCAPIAKREARAASMRRTRQRERDARDAPAPISCRHCGGPVEADRLSKAFCSNACRQAAYRRRHNQERGDLDEALAAHFAMKRAVDAAWRKMARSQDPRLALGPIIDGILTKCGLDLTDAEAGKEVRAELERQLRNYRPRRLRARAAPQKP